MLLISKTPLRVSFFGGGTDYPEYFRHRRGAVIGMAINKYIYIAALKLSGIQSYKYRLAYSQVERTSSVSDIQHPVVKAALDYHSLDQPLDISVMADMPANAGLGSSSTFTVGLLNLLSKIRSENVTKLDLALRAIHLERDLLTENVGVQDQMHAAFGGLNRFEFDAKGYKITPLMIRGDCLNTLLESLFLVYTGVTRHASSVVSDQVVKTREGYIDAPLEEMLQLVDHAYEVILNSEPSEMVASLGALLNEAWRLKKAFSTKISNQAIDDFYSQLRSAGALGCKLCGAGGGGFFLAVVPQDRRQRFFDIVGAEKITALGIDTQGSTILYQ